MKYYIALSSTRDGDHEYGEQFTLEAENEQVAEGKAKKYLLNVYADPELTQMRTHSTKTTNLISLIR